MGQINQKLVNIRGANPPSNPGIGDLWWEASAEVQWFWNGSYWLSEQLFKFESDEMLFNPASSSPNTFAAFMPELNQANRYNLFLVDFSYSMTFTDADTSSNYWSVRLRRANEDAARSTITTLSGESNATGKLVIRKSRLNTLLDLAVNDVKFLDFATIKTGTPGNAEGLAALTYRWVRS